MNSSPLHPAQACLEQSATRTGPVAFRRPIAHVLAFALVATFGVYGLSDPSQSQSAPAKAAPAPVKEERGLGGHVERWRLGSFCFRIEGAGALPRAL